MIIKRVRSFITILSLAAAGATPAFAVMDQITTLSALTGSNVGTVDLSWIAPQEGCCYSAADYAIRYRPNNPIITQADFDNAIVWPNRPNPPRNFGLLETHTVSNLTPGVSYYFSVISWNMSTWSVPSSSAGAKALDSCPQGPYDGLGTATISPTTVPVGPPQNFTLRYTASVSSVMPGGKFSFRVPNNWPTPKTTGSSGLVTFTPPANGANLSMVIDGLTVTFTVIGSTPLVNAAPVDIVYHSISPSCNSGGQVTFVFGSQFQPCGQMTNLASPPQVTLQSGVPEYVSFELDTLTLPTFTIMPIQMKVRDFCNNEVALATAALVNVRGKKYTGSSYITDPDIDISTQNDMFQVFPSTGGDLYFSVGASSKTFYYRVNSNIGNPQRRLESEHGNFRGGTSHFFDFLQIQAVSGGITGVSVDTGTFVSGQKAVTFTPDGDNQGDVAYINFTMPSDMSYRVDFSSDGFQTVARTLNGSGTQARIAWYGEANQTQSTIPEYVPAGTYNVRIADNSNLFINQTATVTLVAASATGFVTDGSQGIPNVNVFFNQTPLHRNGRTNSQGRYTINGLKAGPYQVNLQKNGYQSQSAPVTVQTNVTVHSTFTLQQAAMLNLHFTRPNAAYLPELWGNVRANTSNWSSQAYGTVHFAQGLTTSDAGDYWSATPSSYTSLNLSPGLQHMVHTEIPSYTIADFPVTISSSVYMVIPLTGAANIEGSVSLPSNPNGMWISVEAGPDVNMDGIFDNQDPSHRYYGGTFVTAGSTTGIHRIFGVRNTTYTLFARATGFVQQELRGVVVANGIDVTNANFPMFNTGGVIQGTVTVNGNTEELDNLDSTIDGRFPIYINSWSPSSYNNSWTRISLATSATQTSSTYTLSGLANGQYQIFINLNGFEITPTGPITATVASGVGTRDITLQEVTGSLTGTVSLPGVGTMQNVDIDLLPANSGFNSTSAPVIRSTQPNSSGVYIFNRLGTGYYTLRAVYTITGIVVEKSIVISNGLQSTANLDLTGTTYMISGTVQTTADSPFNSMNYLVTQTTPTLMFNQLTQTTTTRNAHRIVVERIRNNDFYGGGMQSSANGIPFDPKKTFFGNYDPAGAYSIPNLSPGVYRIYNNAELDNDLTNGDEIAETVEIIYVSGNLTKDFTLTSGYDVSGTLSVVSNLSETGRDIEVFLQNNNYQTVASKRIHLTGTSASFSLEHIPTGNYLLGIRDNGTATSQTPKYMARDTLVEIETSDVTGKTIELKSPARVSGTLRVATSGELITSSNYSQLLPDAFRAEARSNPWVQGGYGFAQYPLIDANSKFNIFLNEGTYDVLLRTEGFIGEGAIAQGKKQFIPLTMSGITVNEGQTLDLGVIDLNEGTPLRGTITAKSGGAPLPNVLVAARRPGDHHADPITATTNHLGQYTLYGLDPNLRYNVIAAPRPDIKDTRFLNFSGPRYGEVLKKNVTAGPTDVNFQLELALGSVRGTVITPDNGPLFTPFDENPEPGASIIMNPVGNTPEDNPLGDIEVKTEPDGTFEVSGLVPGSYDLWAIGEGYGSGLVRSISVGVSATPVQLGNISLVAGSKLYGTLTKPGGGLPNDSEVDGFVAVRDSFRDLIIAKLNKDVAGNITGYSMSGFQTGKAYDILLFSNDDDVIVLGTGITVDQDTERNFTITDTQTPRILTQAKKNLDGSVSISYEFTKALRNSEIDINPANNLPDDNELDQRFVLTTGNGTLDIPTTALSSDRRRLIITYTPSAGETQFTINANVTFNAVDASNTNYTATQNNTFHIGIGNSSTRVITNITGGTTELEDGSEFSTQPGTFGEDASDAIEVTMRSADSTGNFAGANPQGSNAMSVASRLGLQAYPQGMAAAISKARTSSIDPFSSFYDIFLPANVSHFFPEGREAEICLAYDDDVTDPYSLNIYYFNESTNEYLLEQEGKVVDTVNQRICASIAHASVFTVLNSSDSIVTGGSYSGELSIINFPNPFNLKSKMVTLQDPGSVSASQTIDGTMIKMSIPSTMAGNLEVQIFNVVGEKVRTLQGPVSTGGAHFYMEWDGKNDHGQKVASGTYIARFTVGGANERFFKMAVLK